MFLKRGKIMDKTKKGNWIFGIVILVITLFFGAMFLRAENLEAAEKIRIQASKNESAIKGITVSFNEGTLLKGQVMSWFELWLTVLHILPIIYAFCFFKNNLALEKIDDDAKKEKQKVKCKRIKDRLIISVCLGWPLYMLGTYCIVAYNESLPKWYEE